MKLNLGCGYDIKKDYVNVDYIKKSGVDIVCDLNKFPYPFKNNSADEILANDIIEHLDNPISVFEEMRRIIKPNGIIKIRLPHFSCSLAHNPVHKTYWNSFHIDYFCRKGEKGSMEQFKWFKKKK